MLGEAVISKDKMPDVSKHQQAQVQGELDWVGMSAIKVPIKLLSESGEAVLQPCEAEAFVNLGDSEAKGIHMSRLFLSLQNNLSSEVLSSSLLKKILNEFVEQQEGLSINSKLNLKFQLIKKQNSLLSGLSAWRDYPIEVEMNNLKGEYSLVVKIDIPYSSTCPCSAALARQLVQEKFEFDFEESSTDFNSVKDWLSKESTYATPHAQRSYARLRVQLTAENLQSEFCQLIDNVEATLGTAVQSIVKREDEQEFAKRNGQNLMFCEDAARRIQELFSKTENIKKFEIEVEHQESLHAHNAVSRVSTF